VRGVCSSPWVVGCAVNGMGTLYGVYKSVSSGCTPPVDRPFGVRTENTGLERFRFGEVGAEGG